MNKIICYFSEQELTTVLAALQFYLDEIERTDGDMPKEIVLIAAENNVGEPLYVDEIRFMLSRLTQF